MKGRFSVDRSLLGHTRQRKVQEHLQRMDRCGAAAKQRVLDLQAQISSLHEEFRDRHLSVCSGYEAELASKQTELIARIKEYNDKDREQASYRRQFLDNQGLQDSAMQDTFHLKNENQRLQDEMVGLKAHNEKLQNELNRFQEQLNSARKEAAHREGEQDRQVAALEANIKALELHQQCFAELVHPSVYTAERDQQHADISQLRKEDAAKARQCEQQQQKHEQKSIEYADLMEKVYNIVQTLHASVLHGENVPAVCDLNNLILSPSVLFQTSDLLTKDLGALLDRCDEERKQHEELVKELKTQLQHDVDLKNAEKMQLEVELASTLSQQEETGKELLQARDDLNEMRTKYELLQTAHNVLEGVVYVKEQEASELQQKVSRLEMSLESSQDTVVGLEKQLKQATSQYEQEVEKQCALQIDLDALKTAETDLRADLNTKSTELGTLSEQISQLQNELCIKDSEQVEAGVLHRAAMEMEKSVLESALAVESRKCREKALEQDCVVSDLQGMSRKMEQLQEELRQAKAERSAAETDADECRTELQVKSHDQSERIIALQSQVQEWAQKLSQSEDTLQKFQHDSKQQEYSLQGSIDQLKQALKSKEFLLQDKEGVIEQLTEQVEQLSQLKAALESDLQASKHTIAMQTQEIALLHESIADSVEENSNLQVSVARLKNEVDKRRKDISLLEFKVKELQIEANSQKREYDMTIQEIDSLARAQSQRSGLDVSKENVRLLNIATRAEQDRAAISEEVKGLHVAVSALETEKNDQQSTNLRLSREYNNLIEQYDQQTSKCNALEQQVTTLTDDLTTAQEDLAIAETVQNMLESNMTSPNAWQKKYEDLVKQHAAAAPEAPEGTPHISVNTTALQKQLSNVLTEKGILQQRVLNLESEVQRVKEELKTPYQVLSSPHDDDQERKE